MNISLGTVCVDTGGPFLEEVIFKHSNVQFLYNKIIVGSFLFSYFRQKTHWDYTYALSPEEVQFVISIFDVLEKKCEMRGPNG